MTKSTGKILWPDGLKKTEQRKCVMDVLENADFPLTALDIYNKMKGEGAAVWLSTVYRILELFTEKDMATKSSVLDNGMAVYEMNRHEHKHYAYCVACRKIFVMDDCPLETYAAQLKVNHFHVSGHKLEIYGYCDSCYAKLV